MLNVKFLSMDSSGNRTNDTYQSLIPLVTMPLLTLLIALVTLIPGISYHRVDLTPCRSYHHAIVKYCNFIKLLVLFLKHLGSVKNIHFGEIFSILFRFF